MLVNLLLFMLLFSPNIVRWINRRHLDWKPNNKPVNKKFFYEDE